MTDHNENKNTKKGKDELALTMNLALGKNHVGTCTYLREREQEK